MISGDGDVLICDPFFGDSGDLNNCNLVIVISDSVTYLDDTNVHGDCRDSSDCNNSVMWWS